MKYEYPHETDEGVAMEVAVPLLLSLGLIALVGLLTWVYRKLGWPTAQMHRTQRGPQPMTPPQGLPGAHFLGANFGDGVGGEARGRGGSANG